ncbi:MAG: hypothetical protein JOY87_05455 [Candidatus Eremiobacteraeota bacterium]|nr:hypothetical protein [Candidatus Eremiobacteraeota bacterium]MBV8460918.1 hypothetical protein [Candidatus Eremiobacteraeota bacterium]MBV8667949.1 hypothetical protein [Candidatus Eremiobacteraeota bacterium]
MQQLAVSSLDHHSIVFGVYRDGDNNLDAVQERNVTDFVKATAANPALKVVAEDTTRVGRAPFFRGQLRTEWSTIQGGTQHITHVTGPEDMSDRNSLAAFVERTLESRLSDPSFSKADVWIDLVDHGGGDGGGLQADSSGGFMSLQDIAGAIGDGKAAFRKRHPGADDTVRGVLANQCLMATVGFADTLSHVGVRYLAASPETMLAPGVPSAAFAQALTQGGDWPHDAVDVTMHTRYGTGAQSYHPAAAFDVLDIDAPKMEHVRSTIGAFNQAVSGLPHSKEGRAELTDIRSDLRAVRGMVRFDHSADMPWHADRPAIASYEAVASDDRLPQALRHVAQAAADAVGDLVLAHKESASFGPFHASYADAIGPTVHLPVTARSYDTWAAQGVVETHNDFYDAVHGRDLARAIGAYNPRDDAAGAVA